MSDNKIIVSIRMKVEGDFDNLGDFNSFILGLSEDGVVASTTYDDDEVVLDFKDRPFDTCTDGTSYFLDYIISDTYDFDFTGIAFSEATAEIAEDMVRECFDGALIGHMQEAQFIVESWNVSVDKPVVWNYN